MQRQLTTNFLSRDVRVRSSLPYPSMKRCRQCDTSESHVAERPQVLGEVGLVLGRCAFTGARIGPLPVTLHIRSGRILRRRSSESVEMRRERCWWACHYDIKVRARQQVRSVLRPWDLS